jgi:hypothetical protein
VAVQPARRVVEERGAAGLALVVAAAFALVVFVTLANVVTMQFARHALRAAAEEAVRAGSRAEAPVAECERRARAVIDGLLGPATRDDVVVACVVSGSPPAVHARADAALRPWLPGLPVWSVSVEATSTREVLP